MKRFLLAAVLAVAGIGIAVSSASAQMTYPYRAPAYGPFYQPGLSPYLNFLRGGDPAANYYLGVVPEFQRRTNANTFSAALNNLESAELQQAVIDTGVLNQLPAGGHPTVFNNTSGYFNTLGSTFPSQRLSGSQRSPRIGMPNLMPGGGAGVPGAGGTGGMGGTGTSSMPYANQPGR